MPYSVLPFSVVSCRSSLLVTKALSPRGAGTLSQEPYLMLRHLTRHRTQLKRGDLTKAIFQLLPSRCLYDHAGHLLRETHPVIMPRRHRLSLSVLSRRLGLGAAQPRRPFGGVVVVVVASGACICLASTSASC